MTRQLPYTGLYKAEQPEMSRHPQLQPEKEPVSMRDRCFQGATFKDPNVALQRNTFSFSQLAVAKSVKSISLTRPVPYQAGFACV